MTKWVAPVIVVWKVMGSNVGRNIDCCDKFLLNFSVFQAKYLSSSSDQAMIAPFHVLSSLLVTKNYVI